MRLLVDTSAYSAFLRGHEAVVEEVRRAGTPVSANDLWIAASAMQHGLRVLTTDPHFRRIAQIAVTFHPAR